MTPLPPFRYVAVIETNADGSLRIDMCTGYSLGVVAQTPFGPVERIELAGIRRGAVLVTSWHAERSMPLFERVTRLCPNPPTTWSQMPDTRPRAHQWTNPNRRGAADHPTRENQP